MLGELTAEQIVDAANAIYQGATAAGYSPAQALEKVQSEAAAYGLSPAEVDAAFRTAYGGAAYAPAQEIVAEVIRTASGYPDIRLEASADETLVRQAAYIYSIQGPAGVVAALLKNGITIDQLAMAVSRTSYIIAQGDASAIINTYWAIADQSRRISDASSAAEAGRFSTAKRTVPSSRCFGTTRRERPVTSATISVPKCCTIWSSAPGTGGSAASKSARTKFD